MRSNDLDGNLEKAVDRSAGRGERESIENFFYSLAPFRTGDLSRAEIKALQQRPLGGAEVAMLPLDSPRWKSFRTYFGTAEQVPQRLASWRHSIGSPDEESQWSDVWAQFLHQFTITDAAYAAVPHVVRELDRIEPRKRFDYLVQLALIESARQTDAGSPTLAPDLADSYHTAVSSARRFAAELFLLEWPKIEFRYLMSIMASLYGHGGLGHLIFNLDCLCGQCPKCGEFVYPDRIQDSGYVK